jgi:nitrogen fixation/metabolism regulation signal transduction histidine kinase
MSSFGYTACKTHNSQGHSLEEGPSDTQSHFLQTVLEGLTGGVLILSESGQIVHANHQARHFCQLLLSPASANNAVPETIWHLCQSLLESRELFPHQNLILESEQIADRSTILRLKVRQFNFARSNQLYILVTIEECRQHS